MCLIVTNLRLSYYLFTTYGIIYDTHGANIYINICTAKFFIQFFQMTIDYQEEIVCISKRIRVLRKAKRLTIQELAYRCDMERSNLSRIESGRTNLTIKTICVICNALNVSMRDIIQ